MTHPTSALGEAIRRLRGARSQAECAERADLDAAAWSAYEGGRRRPGERNLQRILHGLDCSRLELEELVWLIRRGRLLRDSHAGEQPSPPSPLSGDDTLLAHSTFNELLERVVQALEILAQEAKLRRDT